MRLKNTACHVTAHYLPGCGSTNTEILKFLEHQQSPQQFLLVTMGQSAGRGRMSRSWQDTPGKTLATSYFVPEADVPAVAGTWLPLLAGFALTRALGQFVSACLKWPNDIILPVAEGVGAGAASAAKASGGVAAGAGFADELARARGGYKLCGVLCEKVPGGYVIGAGINVFNTREEMMPGAASLATAGVAATNQESSDTTREQLVDELLSKYVLELQAGLRQAASDLPALAGSIEAATATIGQRVRVTTPDGAEILGIAAGLGERGELLVDTDSGSRFPVTAGDIAHLRLLD